jgi:hypothetical protein
MSSQPWCWSSKYVSIGMELTWFLQILSSFSSLSKQSKKYISVLPGLPTLKMEALIYDETSGTIHQTKKRGVPDGVRSAFFWEIWIPRKCVSRYINESNRETGLTKMRRGGLCLKLYFR